VKDEAVTTWVKPALIAEVKFNEWTSSGEMRHPVYLGLREDKRAVDVVREDETHKRT
jgi:bifunctional non-homologous end joining protein LigD